MASKLKALQQQQQQQPPPQEEEKKENPEEETIKVPEPEYVYPEDHIEKIIEGDGKSYPKEGNVVEVHYQGLLPDGTVFDDTRKRDRPFRFRLKTGEVRICFV